MLGRWITGLKCFDGLFVGCSVNRGTEPKNWGISVPENQEPNKNRFSRFRFFRFRFPVLSVRFSVLGFSCPGLPAKARVDPAARAAAATAIATTKESLKGGRGEDDGGGQLRSLAATFLADT
jgi:hypothetical protein